MSKMNESMRSICLENIGAKSEWVRMDADDLLHYTRQLCSLPEYETQAEFAVALAYAALERAMKSVRLAHDELVMKRGNQPVVICKHIPITEAAQ